ncbi:MAG: GTP-binding protein [Burkholderiaceae bacterium]
MDALNLLADFTSTDLLEQRGETAGPEDNRRLASLLTEQIEFADVVVVNKIDTVDATQARRGHRRGQGAEPGRRHRLYQTRSSATRTDPGHGPVRPGARLRIAVGLANWKASSTAEEPKAAMASRASYCAATDPAGAASSFMDNPARPHPGQGLRLVGQPA